MKLQIVTLVVYLGLVSSQFNEVIAAAPTCTNPEGELGVQVQRVCSDLFCIQNGNTAVWKETFSTARCCSYQRKGYQIGQSITSRLAADGCTQYSLACVGTIDGPTIDMKVESLCAQAATEEMLNDTNKNIHAIIEMLETSFNNTGNSGSTTSLAAPLKKTSTPKAKEAVKHTIFRCEASQAIVNFHCEECFDGIVLTDSNGWHYNTIRPAWVMFYLDKPVNTNTIIIKSGTARPDHHLTDFKIDLMVGCGLQAATGVSVNHEDAVISGPRVNLPKGHEKLRIAFDRQENVNAVKLTVFDSDASNHNTVITEVFVLDIDDSSHSSVDLIMAIL